MNKIKQQLLEIQQDIAGISRLQQEVAALLSTVRELQNANKEKHLEARIDDLE